MLDTKKFWTDRYSNFGNGIFTTSGYGSYGVLADYKANFLNTMFDIYGIKSVIDIGFGDGNQLSKLKVKDYTGFEIAQTAIDLCVKRFPDFKFKTIDQYDGEKADLSMSLDVIFHMTSDDLLNQHLDLLKKSSNRYIVIYGLDSDTPPIANVSEHVRFNKFSDKMGEFKLICHESNPHSWHGNPENETWSDFYVFRK